MAKNRASRTLKICLRLIFSTLFGISVLALTHQMSFANSWDECSKITKETYREMAVSHPFVMTVAIAYSFVLPTYTSTCYSLGMDEWSSTQQIELFIAINYEAIQEQASQGRGQHLNALTQMLGCSQLNGSELSNDMKSKYAKLFQGSQKSQKILFKKINQIITINPLLKKTCTWNG